MLDDFGSPILYYYGAKYNIRRWTIGFFEHHKMFIDGFCGTAIIALSKPLAPEMNIVNDRSEMIVNYLRILQREETCAELARRLEFTPFARDEFCHLMKIMHTDPDPIERARAFAAGSFMTPASITRPTRKSFQPIQFRFDRAADGYYYPEKIDKLIEACKLAGKKLRRYVIENQDVRELLPRYNHENILFYLDPPYPLDSRHRGKKTCEYNFELSDSDHEEIARMVHDSKSQFVIASNENEMYERLYHNFEMHSTRTLVRAGAGGRMYQERIFIKRERRRQMSLFL